MNILSLLKLQGGVSFDKVYQTPTLSGNYDNYNIENLQSYSTLVFNASNTVKIRGLNATGANDWQCWLVINNSDENIKFEYDKGSSLANNRFTGDKAFDIKKNTPTWIIRNPLNNKFLVFKAS